MNIGLNMILLLIAREATKSPSKSCNFCIFSKINFRIIFYYLYSLFPKHTYLIKVPLGGIIYLI